MKNCFFQTHLQARIAARQDDAESLELLATVLKCPGADGICKGPEGPDQQGLKKGNSSKWHF